MEIIKKELTPRERRPDPSLIGGNIRIPATISPNVQFVKTGTPIRPDQEGNWIIDPTGNEAEAIVAVFGTGGEKVFAYRSATIDLKKLYAELELGPKFVAGDRLSIDYVDETGYPLFKIDPKGRWLALGETIVLMDCNVRV